MPDARHDAYRFHAFEVSYFSAKVRPALRYKRLRYDEVRADVREIQRRTGLGFIPILVTPEDETWQDSTVIYDRLEERHPDPPLFPPTPLQLLAAHLVELYVDEFALLPAMHYRWGSELGERTARARFGAMMGSVEAGDRAAARMASARLALGATDETAPAIEAHTRELLDALSTHFEAHAYLLRDHLSFADCALMGPLHGHFFNDLVSRRLLLETAVPVVGWIERCNVPDPDARPDWPADDALEASFVECLRVMGRDAAPILVDGLRAFEDWADRRPANDRKPPRAVGRFESTLRGTPLSRFTGAYAPWLVQRSLDLYGSLAPAERARVDTALAGTGWEAVLGWQPRHRLAKDGFELVFEQ
jgi:glutathione S-transferase